ncbi:lysozyme-like protein [Linderina pennispora]|uniref:Lysozyme-like protein n=1 Tax=Linderina pennispora TaxID=61395 RepID=A0A1Y1WGU3_9FUNG|nr:lysozyme-like protein [Linderina pennispora]ORX72729.1 lysozyme-like protein [Linderina pennispora]
MKFTATALGLLATITTTNAAMSACSKKIALGLTNIYENGDTAFHYDYCENIHDGRGFTAGIAGFCTGTSDAWVVLQEYHKMTGGKDEFSNGSTSGLDGYCSVWGKLGKSDAKFRAAQDKVRDEMYFDPSQKLADTLGAQLDVTRAQLYDTTIQHGDGSDPDSVGALIKKTSASFKADAKGSSGSTLKINGHNVDEIAWLTKFLQVRADDLKNPHNKETQKEWSESVTRVKSYQYVVAQKQYKWSNSIKALDNDGKATTVKC